MKVLSMSEDIEKEKDKATPEGKKIKECLETGVFIPDPVIIGLAMAKIEAMEN
jgi:adenylate kinase family enzyme